MTSEINWDEVLTQNAKKAAVEFKVPVNEVLERLELPIIPEVEPPQLDQT